MDKDCFCIGVTDTLMELSSRFVLLDSTDAGSCDAAVHIGATGAVYYPLCLNPLSSKSLGC